MVKLAEYWDSLSGLQKFFYYFAVPGTLLLILQSLGSILGLFGDGDFDLDDTEAGETEIEGIRFFSVRGIIAFFAIFGWTGIVITESGGRFALALAVSTLAGLLAMAAIGYFFFSVAKLQAKGNLDYRNAVGKTAEVYLTIPPHGKGEGKVNLLIQERYAEVKAVTTGEQSLPTGTLVNVVGVSGNTLTVEQLRED